MPNARRLHGNKTNQVCVLLVRVTEESSMPIHDPATLEKFRQAAAACRSSRAKPRSLAGTAAAAAAAGNGGVAGRCPESAALVPLSPSPFGHHQAASPTTVAETRFSQRDDDDGRADERERSCRGRRRSMAVVTTARWLHQLLPSRTPAGPGHSLAVLSDDESATSDVETNLLRRASVRRDLRDCSDAAEVDRRSRDTFYSSCTTTDRLRLSTASDSVSAAARPASSGDERCSPEVFRRCAAAASDSSDLGGRRRTSSDTDAVICVTTTTTNDPASTDDVADVDRVSDAVFVDPTLLMPNTRPVLRFELAHTRLILFLFLELVLVA